MTSKRALAQKYIQMLGLDPVVVTFESDNIGPGEIFYADGKYWDPSFSALRPVERLTFEELDTRVTQMFEQARKEVFGSDED